MKKTFLSKTIIYILTFMILINSILPAKVYAVNDFYGTSGQADGPEDYTAITVEADGWYKFDSFAVNGQIPFAMTDFFYEKDGENWYPAMDVDYGEFYLLAGVTYYIPTGVDVGGWGTIPASIKPVSGKTVPENTEGAPVEEVWFEDPDGAVANPDEETEKKEANDWSFTVPVSGNYYDTSEFSVDSIYYKDASGNYKKVEVETWHDGTVEHRYVYLEEGLTYYTMDPTTLNNALTGNIEPDDYTNYDDASIVEKIITQALLWIGSGLYAIVCLVVGEEFSIEKIIFNDFSNTKLGFFEGSEKNKFIEDAGLKNHLNDFFNFFTGIALLVYIIILVYMAIRILLGATAEKGSKYKELLLYWVEGIIILFLFPYVMKYAIEINNTFVSFMYENKNVYLEEIGMPSVESDSSGSLGDVGNKIDEVRENIAHKTDFMSIMYNQGMGSGWLTYAICWYVMFFQMIGFLVVYFKRVLIITFLIAIFPLVMISYAIDKIGDAKSQAFGNWVKEFLINVFVQSFHVISYVLIMSLICTLMKDPRDNWLIILIAISFISKGDDILRAIFSLNSGTGSVKGIGSTIAQAAAIKSISGGLRNIKNTIIGPKSVGAQLGKRLSNVAQKGWDKAGNRVAATAARIELDNLPQVMNMADYKSPEEIEKAIRDNIATLLGKNGEKSAEEIRKAADNLTAFMNQTKNKNVQDMLNRLAGGLDVNERVKLDNLLKQNAATNSLIAGGREVNITQNINIILTCMKDENGSAESKAILGKVANSESDLQAMTLFGNVKFNKERNSNGNSNKDSHGRYPSSRGGNTKSKSKVKGRSAAKRRAEQTRARSELDYLMRSNLQVPEAAQTSTPKKERFKVKKKKEGTWTNIKSVKEQKGTTSSKGEGNNPNDYLKRAIRLKGVADSNKKATNSSAATTNYGGKVPEGKGMKNTAPQTGAITAREAKALVQETIAPKKTKVEEPTKNSTAFTAGTGKGTPKKESGIGMGDTPIVNTSSTSNTRRNVGEQIASTQGSAEGLRNVLNRDTFVGTAERAFQNIMTNREYSVVGPNTAIPQTFDFKGKTVSKEAKKDLLNAVAAVTILKDTRSGDYTAKDILGNIEKLKEAKRKYENAPTDERTGLEEILGGLGCKLEDYESYVRVQILNDPDSVGNNREIIEECKAYVKENDMPTAIRNKLGYNLEDLREGQNLKYLRRRETEYDGIVSDDESERLKEEYEQRLRRKELEKDIAKREKLDKEQYGVGSFAKEVPGILKDTLRTGVDVGVKTVGAAGTGFIIAGMTTSGKNESLSEAATGFFSGYSIVNNTYDSIKKSKKEWWEDTKDSFTNEFKDSDPIKETKKQDKKTGKKREDYIDKTKIKSPLFSDRVKKDEE